MQRRGDVYEIIDAQPFGRHQLGIVGLCGLLVFADGFDAQAMGFVAPALIERLNVTRAALGPVISAGLFGMMIGALLCGPLADQFGRKPVLVVCGLTFGIGSLLTATSTSLQEILWFRLITGVGLGGVMPNAIALTSEYSPKRVRNTAVMVMFTGFSLGAAFGGLFAAAFIALYGWQSVFVFGGILPIVIALLCLMWLPESLQFLVAKNGKPEKINSILAKMDVSARPLDFRLLKGPQGKSSLSAVKELFSDRRARVTVLIWTMFFMNLLVLYFLNSWLPTAIHDSGIKMQSAILVTSLFQIGGTLGAILLGRLFDRGAAFGLLAFVYGIAVFSVFLVGEFSSSIAFLAPAVFVAGLCVIGGQTSSNALTAEFYPTQIRSTGIGWALGIGRIGSIVGPTLGGILLSTQGQIKHVFWAAAMASLIASLAALLIAWAPPHHCAAAFVESPKEEVS